ncbi:SEC-C metal-binding domain-containing protein [Colwellia sp. BRX10-4]|nr:SEC-C domain-containing protein [Colwellia sp. BRX10-4]
MLWPVNSTINNQAFPKRNQRCFCHSNKKFRQCCVC